MNRPWWPLTAERGALSALEGSCKTPIGAHARIMGGKIDLIVEALSPDGKHRFRRQGEAALGADPESAARALGLELGAALLADGGDLIVLPD